MNGSAIRHSPRPNSLQIYGPDYDYIMGALIRQRKDRSELERLSIIMLVVYTFGSVPDRLSDS